MPYEDPWAEQEAIETERLDTDIEQAEMDASGPAPAPRTGWAVGIRHETNEGRPSKWLTVPGSAIRTPALHPDKAAAEAELAEHPLKDAGHCTLTVAEVREIWHGGVTSGYSYRILRTS